MIFSSRGLALLLAGGISMVATIILAFFKSMDQDALIAVFVVIFISSFLFLAPVLESLFFRKIKKLRKLTHKLTSRDDEAPEGRLATRLNPFDRITRDMRVYGERTQKEIDELKKLEAFRKEFIADVSHELKTPIFAAQGFVHTLLDGAMKDKTVRNKFLRKAAKSLDGLDMLVQDLLTLSQIETGQIKMHIEEVDLYALTQEVFEQFEGRSQKKGTDLRIAGPVRQVLVYADGHRIGQVITNLISNAIKHSFEGGAIAVSFRQTKKSVTTHVTDFGEGIPKEHVSRIFERFYRVDKSRSREKGGTGLGLAIVKHILDGHHSKPEVESAPGKGSTFSFKLPRVKVKKSENGEDVTPAKD